MTNRTTEGSASTPSPHDTQAFSNASSYAARLIRFKARQLCRRPGFTPSDREDIEQALRADLLERLPRFDASKAGLNTFIARVIERKTISIVRHRFAEKRSPEREECSLNDEVRDGDGRLVDRHQTTPEAASVWQRLHDLTRDVSDLRERLESDLHRRVMDALGRGGTINSVANELGIPRRAVERCMAELREVFEDAGLREYL